MKKRFGSTHVLGLSALLILAACSEDPADPPAPIVPRVSVSDQTLDPANKVSITTVVAAQDGFIVIHEADDDGAIGAAIGNAPVSTGTTPGLDVTLDRDGVDGETLFAMLHIDGDNNGVYEFPDGPDTPVLDSDNNVIAPAFEVTIEGDEPAEASVTVADQVADPANLVVVAEVVLVDNGFIAVHEDDGTGGIGGVIGVSDLLEAGTVSDVEVDLDRDAVDGETLFAMLHIDGDDNGIYEFPGPDVPVQDADGAVIAPPFAVTLGVPEGPVVEVSDQTVEPPNEVIIDRVAFDQNGFIAVHEDDGTGGIGGVIGVSDLLEAGTNEDVVVTLDRDAADGETLFAMLHVDDPANGTYEFPDNGDAPVLDGDDNVVAPAFVVTLAPVEGDPSVFVESQLQDSNSEVLVAEVVSVGPGFMAIHEDNGMGGIGDVVGIAPVSNGLNIDVEVILDKDAVNGERFFAMLHDDANENGIYEFPGPDVPISDENGVIAPPFITFSGNPAPAVFVDDQNADPANEVSVLAAVSDGPGFIAIHEDNGMGSFGAVIGVSEVLDDGVNANILVVLDRPAEIGETLYAMLHTDANDNGIYEFPGEDVPVLDVNDNIITPAFVVNVLLQDFVEVADQVADPINQVVVANVMTNGPGFIAVHEGNGMGGLGGVIGVSGLLTPGIHIDVPVTLDRNANDGETLFAMLHADDPANGTYEFPDNGDAPVLDGDDNVIAPPFVVTVADSVSVDSQTAGGEGNDGIVVREVVFNDGGFIAVHEDNGQGGIGGVVGVSDFLPAGTNVDVAITLDRAVNDGETLFAMLHVDDNDNEIYEFPGPDVPVQDANDVVIAPPFSAFNGEPVERVEVLDQTLDVINVLSVLTAVSDGPGFIAIHEDDNGGIGPVIGVSAVLSDGINSNIVVTLDRNANGGETLYAMLHTDANDNGIYEFPGVDEPVLDINDAVIAPAFEVQVR